MCHEQQLDYARVADGAYDFRPAFALTAQLLRQADFAFGNLETSLAADRFSGYPTFRTPLAFAEALADAGFDGLFVANNHAWDGREAGMRTTRRALDSLGMKAIGGQSGPGPAHVLFRRGAFRLAVLAFAAHSNAPVPPEHRHQLPLLPDSAALAQALAAARREADVVVVHAHFGDEKSLVPNARQRQWAGWAMASGADLVVADHPHVLQPWHRFKTAPGSRLDSGLVAYSLGNFLAHQLRPPTNIGLLLQVRLKPEGELGWRLAAVEAIPTLMGVFTHGPRKQHVVIPLPPYAPDAQASEDAIGLLDPLQQRRWREGWGQVRHFWE
jgi:poly-gamma-glutamate synthesis protein (capsule biosynthesis protein)